jgi:NAD(P) transhydrogenase subunit beta
MAIGAAIGIWRARSVEMTGMPELIAMLHSFVGLAAVLVGWNSSLRERTSPDPAASTTRRGLRRRLHRGGHVDRLDRGLPEARAKMKSAPLMLPGRHWLNLARSCIVFVALTCGSASPRAHTCGN